MTPVERYDALKAYLDVKLLEGDWHAIRDVCADLEVFEAKYPDVKQESKGLWRRPD